MDNDDDHPPDRRPLTFLHPDPFAIPSLLISGAPLSIVDHTQFDEDTDKTSLTAAIGVATTLWNWCPNALRAWLDRAAYYSCEWACRRHQGTPLQHTILLARNDRHISLGYYNYDVELILGCDFGMPEDGGPWIPLSGTLSVGPVRNEARWPAIGQMLARDLLYNPTWQAGRNISHEFIVGDQNGWHASYPSDAGATSKGEVDPHWLYHPRTSDICQRCYRPEDLTRVLRKCTRCKAARYCSVLCQESDWAAHKGVCRKPKDNVS